MSARQHFVTSYIDAWNRHDAVAVVEHLSQDGRYCDVPLQRELGGEALIGYLERYFDREHYHYDLVGGVLTKGTTMAFQYRQHSLDDTSGEPDWEGAEFIELADGVARRINDYYRFPVDAGSESGRSRNIPRYAKSALGDDTIRELLSRLDYLMKQEKLYLAPNLSLPKLAGEMGCSVNHLSQAINAGHRTSFFNFINQFRIADARKLLAQSDCRFPGVLDIALTVGFNSTSTFYTAFKKVTGKTPARYRHDTVG